MSRKTKQYNFDSQGLTYSNNFTYINNNNTTPNSYNIDLILPEILHKVKKISLKSIELPVLFPNIRSPHLNYLLLSNNPDLSNSFRVTLSQNNYTNIDTLLNDLNNTADAINHNLTFSLTSDGFVNIATNTDLYVVPTNFSYLLGFRNGLDVYTMGNVTAVYQYQLNVDNYISLYVWNLYSPSNNANQSLCSFKIPMNATQGIVYYNSQFLSYDQSINIDSNSNINKISVVFYDRFGISINSFGADWSCTLEFEFE